MNMDLNNIYKWCLLNKLIMNMDKTKFMVFTSKIYNSVSIKINNVAIEQARSFKYLGLLIDDKLTFKTHIAQVTMKINRANGLLFY